VSPGAYYAETGPGITHCPKPDFDLFDSASVPGGNIDEGEDGAPGSISPGTLGHPRPSVLGPKPDPPMFSIGEDQNRVFSRARAIGRLTACSLFARAAPPGGVFLLLASCAPAAPL